MHRHTGHAPGIMVLGGVGFDWDTSLVRITGTLYSQRYISEVVEPMVLPYIQFLSSSTLKDNAQPNEVRNVQELFSTLQIELLPWPACSSDILSKENCGPCLHNDCGLGYTPSCSNR
ncbi:UNVERIFIED_CONTAM: hypothetical protein NCL1_23534 [Trichonephila clavipes]